MIGDTSSLPSSRSVRSSNSSSSHWSSVLWLSLLTSVLGIPMFIENHRHNGSCFSDLVTSSASHLAIFASFPGLRVSGGVTSRRLFLQLGAREDCMPRCACLVSSLVSASCRKEQSCPLVIRTTAMLCVSSGVFAKQVLGAKSRS